MQIHRRFHRSLAKIRSHASARFEPLEQRRLLSAAPFTVQGPGVVSSDFQVTTFASKLSFPVGMQQLSDGSYMVGQSVPVSGPDGAFYDSTGELVRLVDNGHGKAERSTTVLYSGLPGMIACVRSIGDLVFVTSAESGDTQISVLRTGATPASPLKLLGSLDFSFPSGWMHLTYGLAVAQAPGTAVGSETYDLYFNVGSQQDSVTTPQSETIPVHGLAKGNLEPDALYRVVVQETRHKPIFSDMTQIATGLRNAAGIAVQPGTGNLYFQDNGINGPDNPDPNLDPELAADTLHVITSRDIGRKIYNYGFASEYIVQATGQQVGSGAVSPLLAFLPIDGSHAEGADDVAFAPPDFPKALKGGLFVGFFGQIGYKTSRSAANTENPVGYVNLKNDTYFQFIPNKLPNIGHPDGLLATSDALFVSDLSSNDDFSASGARSGAVYEIRYDPPAPTAAAPVNNTPPTLMATSMNAGAASTVAENFFGETPSADVADWLG